MSWFNVVITTILLIAWTIESIKWLLKCRCICHNYIVPVLWEPCWFRPVRMSVHPAVRTNVCTYNIYILKGIPQSCACMLITILRFANRYGSYGSHHLFKELLPFLVMNITYNYCNSSYIFNGDVCLLITTGVFCDFFPRY